MNEFVSWCRHLLVSFLFPALTSLHPPSFHRNDFSTCSTHFGAKPQDVQRFKGSFCTAQFRDGNTQNTQHRRKAQTLGDTIVPGLDVGNVNQRGYPSHRD